MKVWIIDNMENKAKLCISIDNEEPQLLVGPDVFKNIKLLHKIIMKANEILKKQIKE